MKLIKIICSILLLIALLNNPYSYYQILRWVITGFSAYLAYSYFESNNKKYGWIFTIIAILFNPILPFFFSREVWQILNIIASVIFVFSLKNKEEKNVDIKVYRHVCLACKNEFNYKEKKGYCPDCGNKFDSVLEYIAIHSLGRFDIYECNDCKVMFETQEKEDLCPRCGKKAIYYNYILKCGRKSFLDKFLP